MARAADAAARERKIRGDMLWFVAVRQIHAAVVHATVKIVPLEAPLLNFTVNESPEFNVRADP